MRKRLLSFTLILLFSIAITLNYCTMAEEQFECLVRNNTGPNVEKLQDKLNELGYSTNPDIKGVFGHYTALAVRRFQQDNGLRISGAATVEVQEMLFSDIVTSKGEIIEAGIKYVSEFALDKAAIILGVPKEQCSIIEAYYLDNGNNSYQFSVRVSKGGPVGVGIGMFLTCIPKEEGGFDFRDENHLIIYDGSEIIPGEMVLGDPEDASIARGLSMLGKELGKLDTNGNGELDYDELFVPVN